MWAFLKVKVAIKNACFNSSRGNLELRGRCPLARWIQVFLSFYVHSWFHTLSAFKGCCPFHNLEASVAYPCECRSTMQTRVWTCWVLIEDPEYGLADRCTSFWCSRVTVGIVCAVHCLVLNSTLSWSGRIRVDLDGEALFLYLCVFSHE